MIKFKVNGAGVALEYRSDRGSSLWVWEKLKGDDVDISQVFTFERGDLVREPTEAELEDTDKLKFQFKLGDSDGDYIRIAGRKLGIENDILITNAGFTWTRKLFAAERDVSIFRRIAKLVEPGSEIIIGGDKDGAIPTEIFGEMLGKFPNSGEMDRYANARVANILGEYLDPLRDFREHYEAYLSKRKSVRRKGPLSAPELYESEIEKFELVRDTIREMLKNGEGSEEEWQKMLLHFLLLIFPKYIAILEKVPVEDRYTNPARMITRQLDLALVDVNGNIDVIEIKKPFEDVLLRKTRYRDSFVPTGDLSGTIMQAEKYLFHLSKWGVDGEKKLTAKYQAQLPPGLPIRITNPKALLILGRDRKADGSAALSATQLFDLEVIKRKYANMMDIITYDDLLRRLESIIASLKRRAAQAGAPGTL